MLIFIYCVNRRVHISRAAFDNLKGAFEVEPGNGKERDHFLAENNIETFLIVGKTKTSTANTPEKPVSTPVQTQPPRSFLKSTSFSEIKTNGVQHLLQNLSETESNEDQDWKPEIPFGNVSQLLNIAKYIMSNISIDKDV